jgi:hypothetical protein
MPLVGMARTVKPNTREVKIKVEKSLMNSMLTDVAKDSYGGDMLDDSLTHEMKWTHNWVCK